MHFTVYSDAIVADDQSVTPNEGIWQYPIEMAYVRMVEEGKAEVTVSFRVETAAIYPRAYKQPQSW